jgi:NAD+ diphosphatase
MSSPPRPQLPEHPALKNDNSMLTRRFGKEVINYYAGGSVNRFSFLRNDYVYLNRAAVSPTARYIALKSLDALNQSKTELAYLSFDDVKSLIGSDPFSKSEEDYIKAFDSTQATPLVVFLGVLENDRTASDVISSAEHGDIKGHPYFAVDITPKAPFAENAESFLKAQEDKGLSIDSNARAMHLEPDSGMSYSVMC